MVEGLNPQPTLALTYLLVIQQGAAPISDFASYEIIFEIIV